VTRIVIAAVVLLGIVGYRVFFVDSNEVLKFNDTLVDMVTQADTRFKPITLHFPRG
jgi:hypothetical protein